jgi:hypothetical protein
MAIHPSFLEDEDAILSVIDAAATHRMKMKPFSFLYSVSIPRILNNFFGMPPGRNVNDQRRLPENLFWESIRVTKMSQP